jgi:hypothetical protein
VEEEAKRGVNIVRYKVICIDFENPARENWKDVIPQSSKDVLSYVICINSTNFLVCWIRDVVVRMTLLPSKIYIAPLVPQATPSTAFTAT